MFALLLVLIGCQGPRPNTQSWDTGGVANQDPQELEPSPWCKPGNPWLGGEVMTVLGSNPDVAPLLPDGYPVVVTVHGGWSSSWEGSIQPLGRPWGFLQVYLNLPNDLRSGSSVVALSDALRYVTGSLTDDQGCTFRQKMGPDVPISRIPPIILGQSNGGNLALVALAEDPHIPVSGLVTYETPFGSQFVNFELGTTAEVNPSYHGCSWTIDGMDCPMRPTWDPDTGSVRVGDYQIDGLSTPDGRSVFSLPLTEAIPEDPSHLSPDEALDFWLLHDGSLRMEDVARNYPYLQVISIGTEADHAASVNDHAHVSGIVAAFDRMGVQARVNPSPEYMEVLRPGRWPDNPIPSHPGDSRIVMAPDEESIGLDSTSYVAPAVMEILSLDL